ncbi:TPA: hypothetical protein LZ417_001574 [Escherichia coli]|nr:hypothetical protein [Escherichia coli]
MFGKIILTAMLTTSSATAEDAGKNIASGLATASTRQIGQAIMPTLGKVRTSIPRTKNENFSHLISMGYQ